MMSDLIEVTQADRIAGAENFWNRHKRRGLLEPTYDAMRQGDLDDHEDIQALAAHRTQAITAHAAAINPVEHWYQSDEEHPRPLVDIFTDIVEDLQEDREQSLKVPALTAENERLREARNLAYGLLWAMQPIDRTNHKDDVACRAREALLATMTKDDQSAGIAAARAALKGNSHDQ